MQKIGIIGAGFMGTMTAIQLIKKTNQPIEIILVNDQDNFAKGIAFNPYSKKQLLNVIVSKMSAYSDQPEHFLDWLMLHPKYLSKNRDMVASAFVPRALYGDYLVELWQNAQKEAAKKDIKITTIVAEVEDLKVSKDHFSLTIEGKKIEVDQCVIASGNLLPRNPRIRNVDFYASENYYQNPWALESVTKLKADQSVLIIGNGLTMVDTVLGLLEHGFTNSIYSISPNGFNILPHRYSGAPYPNLTKELSDKVSLRDMVSLFNKHVKSVRELGLTAEPIVDSLRAHTQTIWKNLSEAEKAYFMSKLRHLWGVARHRIPLQIHDKIQQLRINRRLNVISGNIIDMNENKHAIKVDFRDNKTKQVKSIVVSRVINCTGPETNIENLEQSFLKNLLDRGVISQDALKLGLNADTETFEVKNQKGVSVPKLYTAGSLLKGELWESTAVNELRAQADKLSNRILSI